MEKINIRVKGEEIDIEGSIDEAIIMLQKYKDQGWTEIDKGYYGEYSYYFMRKYRLETDHELTIRMKMAEDQKEARRREYEKLKKEFGE